jgi:phosphoribosyl 1,2-cyclic phosphodiesterase
MARERFVVRYWGVRGSIAVPGPGTVVYGGNTTCIEVRCDDTVLIIDAGTGARELGDKLRAELGDTPLSCHIVFSHFHLDHIQGFPFFSPIYDPRTTIHVHSHRPRQLALQDALAGQMTFPWFPVELENLEATLAFHDVRPGEAFEVEGIRIDTCPLNHPGGAMAIRVNHRGHAFVQASDVEHHPGRLADDLVGLARGADFLSYDSTYVEGHDYESHRGWGHSTWQAGLAVAQAAGVGRFIAFHHDPSHDDGFMDRVANDLEAIAPGSLVAREGLTLDLLSGKMEVVPPGSLGA